MRAYRRADRWLLTLMCLLVWAGISRAQHPIAQTPGTGEQIVRDTTEVALTALSPSLKAEPEIIGLDSLRAIYPTQPMAVIFTALPDDLVPLLTQRMRLDMVDYAIAGQRRAVKNKLTGNSWVDTLSNNYMRVRMTAVSTLELAIYDGGKGIVAFCYTISPDDGAPDSQLEFFTKDMKPLNSDKILRQPGSKEFLSIPKNSGIKMSELEALIPFPTVAYTLHPDREVIDARLTVTRAMLLESTETIKPYLRPNLVYRWAGGRFLLEK